jgi:hypothetical protein
MANSPSFANGTIGTAEDVDVSKFTLDSTQTLIIATENHFADTVLLAAVGELKGTVTVTREQAASLAQASTAIATAASTWPSIVWNDPFLRIPSRTPTDKIARKLGKYFY